MIPKGNFLSLQMHKRLKALYLYSMQIVYLQKAILEEIQNIGGRIVFNKQWGWLARAQYKVFGKEPIINIEALLLGEKFGIILGYSEKGRYLAKASRYRIFEVETLQEFKQQFGQFKSEKLLKD